ncbi:hypothetical protein M011DRAFT_458374 [Sporormia fimetaria CBS 119925]|uniref:Uncharacterized protein n=1 Tax=Sporormia fimetaria CBS 119925 TaxID=1340428 RepID=A0A6A6VAC9_9PLEO|nr:hypothetical protein M011DRAFT_458374 [Sporormia fimetaria CBS 119925]
MPLAMQFATTSAAAMPKATTTSGRRGAAASQGPCRRMHRGQPGPESGEDKRAGDGSSDDVQPATPLRTAALVGHGSRCCGASARAGCSSILSRRRVEWRRPLSPTPSDWREWGESECRLSSARKSKGVAVPSAPSPIGGHELRIPPFAQSGSAHSITSHTAAGADDPPPPPRSTISIKLLTTPRFPVPNHAPWNRALASSSSSVSYHPTQEP